LKIKARQKIFIHQDLKDHFSEIAGYILQCSSALICASTCCPQISRFGFDILCRYSNLTVKDFDQNYEEIEIHKDKLS